MKAKFGSIVVAGSGKIGGHVVARNRSGAYFRTKVTPVNPRSTFQTTNRAKFGQLSQAWRGLTDAQRAEWVAAVPLFAKTNVFGDLIKPTGANLYIQLNANLALVGAGPISSPPLSTAVNTVTATAAAAAKGAGTMTITFNGTTYVGSVMVIRATPGISPGISYVKNRLRNFRTAASGIVSPLTVSAAYITRYGAIPEAGQKIVFEIMFINATTGVPSARQTISCVVAV